MIICDVIIIYNNFIVSHRLTQAITNKAYETKMIATIASYINCCRATFESYNMSICSLLPSQVSVLNLYNTSLLNKLAQLNSNNAQSLENYIL